MRYRSIPESKRNNLSLESQGEHILKYGSLKEIVTWVKKYRKIAKKVYEQRLSKDLLFPDKSKKLIHHILELEK